MKKLEGLKSAKNLEKIPPTIGLNIAKINKSQGEFIFWDVGGQRSLRKIWGKYFSECNGVVFLIDGCDEDRFSEVREVIDSLYTRKVLDDAGLPKIQKTGSAIFDDDMESGGGADEDKSIYQILQELPVLFLLNKNDKPEFKGEENIEYKLGLKEINCMETKCIPISALDLNGVDSALSWIYKSIPECVKLSS